MYCYAQLNENGICMGVSSLSGEVQAENMVKIDSYSEDFLYRKYENGVWSTDKYEPQSTAPLSEFESLKKENAELKQSVLDLTEIVLGGN